MRKIYNILLVGILLAMSVTGASVYVAYSTDRYNTVFKIKVYL